MAVRHVLRRGVNVNDVHVFCQIGYWPIGVRPTLVKPL